jgi:hypothetical protein
MAYLSPNYLFHLYENLSMKMFSPGAVNRSPRSRPSWRSPGWAKSARFCVQTKYRSDRAAERLHVEIGIAEGEGRRRARPIGVDDIDTVGVIDRRAALAIKIIRIRFWPGELLELVVSADTDERLQIGLER